MWLKACILYLMHKHLYCSQEDHHHAHERSFQQPPCSVCSWTDALCTPQQQLPSLSCLFFVWYLKAKPNHFYSMWRMQRIYNYKRLIFLLPSFKNHIHCWSLLSPLFLFCFVFGLLCHLRTCSLNFMPMGQKVCHKCSFWFMTSKTYLHPQTVLLSVLISLTISLFIFSLQAC